MNNQQTVPATTTTLLDVIVPTQMWIKAISNSVYVGYNSDVDNTDGYLLLADTDYVFTAKTPLYIYAASETVVHYITI